MPERPQGASGDEGRWVRAMLETGTVVQERYRVIHLLGQGGNAYLHIRDRGGPDWLGSAESLATETSRVFYVSLGSYDLKASDCDNQVLVVPWAPGLDPKDTALTGHGDARAHRPGCLDPYPSDQHRAGSRTAAPSLKVFRRSVCGPQPVCGP